MMKIIENYRRTGTPTRENSVINAAIFCGSNLKGPGQEIIASRPCDRRML